MTSLSVQDLTVRYHTPTGTVTAVDAVSLEIPDGATLGLVGESGSGKSSLARAIVGLAPAHAGTIRVADRNVRVRTVRDRRQLGRQAQIVFQDPDTALDPRMTVRQTLAEAAAASGRVDRRGRGQRIADLLTLVGLDPQHADRLPRQLSGGQRQRVAIARALVVEPRLLIADEITSALDVSVQASILNTIRDIQRQLGVSMLFVGHNLAAVRYVSDVIAVMYLGQIVEVAPATQLLDDPQHPYTRALLSAVPTLGARATERQLIAGDVPDPADPPTGCRFHPRCPVGPARHIERDVCRDLDPHLDAGQRPHQTACHFTPVTIEDRGDGKALLRK